MQKKKVIRETIEAIVIALVLAFNNKDIHYPGI